MKSTEAGAAKFLGMTDEVNACDCCGRTNLKSTVALSFDEAEPVYFGVVCAARALRMEAKDVRKSARTADDERHQAEQLERQKRHDAEMAAWSRYLDARDPAHRGSIPDQLRALGGYAVARAAFKAEGANA